MPDPELASRKGKERQAPQPTDFAERLVALQRKQAHASKPRERVERTQPPTSSASTPRPAARPSSPRRLRAPPLPNPDIVVSQPSPSGEITPDEQDFSRRLKISQSSSRDPHVSPRGTNGGRLYNPHTDGIRTDSIRRSATAAAAAAAVGAGAMTAEPDTISDAASSTYAPRGPAAHPSRSHLRSQPGGRASGDAPRLFDPRKDNPHQFSVLQRGHGHGPSPILAGRPPPTPKSSGDWVSASSTSSAYAHSTISSNFTLSSTTTGSSASSALFDNGAPRSEDSAGPSALSTQLKRLYREILSLESRVQRDDREREMAEDADRAPQRVEVLTRSGPAGAASDMREGSLETEKERYRRMLAEHKELAEIVHRMLTLTLAPTVPQSLKIIPVKYGLVGRLWNHGFHRLLEILRRDATSGQSEVAFELLQEFIYHAYTFYTNLFEEHNLMSFRSSWVESLGDIARYHIALSGMKEMRAAAGRDSPAVGAAMVGPPTSPITSAALSANQNHLTPAALHRRNTPDASALTDNDVSPIPAIPTGVARRDESSSIGLEALRQDAENEREGNAKGAGGVPQGIPSVGVAAARLMVLEPEKERWRAVSKDWYLKGLAYAPGMGKLHHHLGLLSRDADIGEKEELRAVYHFMKSMITFHSYENSRETVLGMWTASAQRRRQAPDASLTELFVHIHGMLFTNIQMDDFKPTLARFEEKLVIEGAEVEDRFWMMMALMNVCAILEYGRESSVLFRVAGIHKEKDRNKPSASPVAPNGGKVKVISGRPRGPELERMDIDDEDGAVPSPAMSEAAAAGAGVQSEPELSFSLRMALQLTFRVLAHVLERPVRERGPFRRSTLNPYITIILTFLATALKDKVAERVYARHIPWEALAKFFANMPRIVAREVQRESAAGLLSSGCHPLPEDWCMRGLGWSGRRVYERGFWSRSTGGEDRTLEADVLDASEQEEETMDGIIEDEDDDGQTKTSGALDASGELTGRWVRVARAAFKISKAEHGFVFVPPTTRDGRGEWRVQGTLADKVAQWREQERQEREEEERRLQRTRWVDDDTMDMDIDEDEQMESISEESEDDEDDSGEVRELKARRRYLQSLLESSQVSRSASRRKARPSMHEARCSRLRFVPGYTILVVDTNILLSSLSMFASLVECLRWTVVLPLPVIMELDGLASNQSALGDAAKAATAYIMSHLRSHSASLKIQTSRGNYLPNLTIRTEQVDFDGKDGASWERNMDDLILRAAIWQTEHWFDRSAFLNVDDEMRDTTGASKVVLLSFDRNLRLKARSRELDAANEGELASILAGRP